MPRIGHSGGISAGVALAGTGVGRALWAVVVAARVVAAVVAVVVVVAACMATVVVGAIVVVDAAGVVVDAGSVVEVGAMKGRLVDPAVEPVWLVVPGAAVVSVGRTSLWPPPPPPAGCRVGCAVGSTAAPAETVTLAEVPSRLRTSATGRESAVAMSVAYPWERAARPAESMASYLRFRMSAETRTKSAAAAGRTKVARPPINSSAKEALGAMGGVAAP
mmetsp:Transcript_107689/g.332702  ORF Transcript_107689/g.332702 Transcript_107689/m.332702 type:complete len:219 (+) Transcript_107689:1685-2341(+)